VKTIVLQSYRTRDVPDWITRCLASVRAWTEQSGYDYRFVDDRIFDLCGSEYLARVGDNKRSITNLARLELTRTVLDEGYDRAIWFDADIFIFAPDALSIDVTARYAFSKEAWITVDGAGQAVCTRSINNAAFVFMRDEPDLGFLISTIRHVAAHRDLRTNYQVGVSLLTGLEQSLDFALLRTVGMLSPFVLRAIVDGDVHLLRRQAIEFGDPIFAANLCLALAQDNPEDLISAAMDRLEATRGNVINQYVPAGGTGAGPWHRCTQPSPPPQVSDPELGKLRNEVAAAHAQAAAATLLADQLAAENQSFRRSRLLRLGRVIRRSLGLPHHR
jgi:hypothetical protein